ncbi:MAG: response regulator [Candidatus Omnitrophica bacterium]|nr:response regulator [Candidatus Omnitrophota bacterium]
MGKRVLIADDEPTVVALARNKLEERGYIVDIARNGKEAWDIINARPIDILITDVVMPVMDGVDLYKEIKKTPRLADIPIVIITDSRIFRESFQTLGVEHFLPKPLDPDKLLFKVETVLAKAALGRKNNQVLILGSNEAMVNDMSRILTEQMLVVGKSLDPIDFIHNCLVLTPRVILVDILLKGDIAPAELVRALKVFARMRDSKIVVYTKFSSEDIGNAEGIEQLRQIKNECLEAGADRYIGRYTPATFWESVKEFFF